MREILADVVSAWRAGERAGLATVIGAWSSAPRPVGAAMLVRADGSVVGGVSGGCVEGAVYELCRTVGGSGPPQTAVFGVSDEDAFEVGLPCGGTIEVFVEPAGFPHVEKLAAAVAENVPVALLTVVTGEPELLGRHVVLSATQRFGSLGDGRVDEFAAREGRGLLAAGRTDVLRHGRLSVLVNSFPAPARMLIFGANDHAAALARMGSFLGYRVTVCDARAVFTTRERFPDADEVVVEWPHRYLGAEAAAGRVDARTVVCVLTHDPKFDVPVLREALRLPLAYVGAMGSRRTQEERLKRLRESGLTDAQFDRMAAPAGLDLNARTPPETAVSIVADILAARGNATGRRLADLTGPIHHGGQDRRPP